MSLIYGAIAVDGALACEYSLQGNAFHAQTAKLVQGHKAPTSGGGPSLHKASYESGEKHLFNVLTRKNVTYVAVCDNVTKHQALAFKYLEKVHNTFMSKFTEQVTASDIPSMPSFNTCLKGELEYFNSPEADKLTKLQGEIDEVKSVMHQNLDKIIDRGENMDKLVVKTEDLAVHSQDFFENSNTLRKRMFWKNVRIVIGIFCLLALIIFILVVLACGGFGFKDCKSKTTPAPSEAPPTPAPNAP